MLDAFEHGVCFVNLAPVRDPDLVVTTIAQALDVREAGDQPLLGACKTSARAGRCCWCWITSSRWSRLRR